MAPDHVRRSHAPPVGMIPVPGGPHGYDTIDGELVNDNYDEPFDKQEKDIFRHLLCPSDIYTEEGVYWGDLPFWKRLSFNTKVENKEARRELGVIWQMFKEDPLSPIAWYFRNAVLPGAGMLLEGYVLFSVGNVKSLFQDQWPQCWNYSKWKTSYQKEHPGQEVPGPVCNKTWLAAVDYLEICGIICGQIGVGFIGDALGRRWGLIQDAVIMFVGLVMLTAMWGKDLNGWIICYSWSLFFYSIGVGGEYPMTATSGMERAGTLSRYEQEQDRLHRGRRVVSAFLMQGWGQFFNQVILILCILIFHHGSGLSPFSKVSVQWTFRVSFAIPAVGTLLLVYLRSYKMPNISKALDKAKKEEHVTGYDIASFKLILQHYGFRLFATSIVWFFNDVFFYGNKLFQSDFISAIIGDGNSEFKVMLGWLYNLINIGVSLAGYYLASFLVDTRLYGRNWMMQIGFAAMFILFLVPGFDYCYFEGGDGKSTCKDLYGGKYADGVPKSHTKGFQAMYFLSSFFNQFGPNCVTFLVAAEVYPTQVRATAHGLSAGIGKLGALMASILYNYIGTTKKFHFIPWWGLAGMVVTFMFMPDTTGLDLREQDRRFKYISEGRESEYHGTAIHWTHLSWYERFRGMHKNYNADADFKQKVDEMREDWENRQRQKFNDEADIDDHKSQFTPSVNNFFIRTSPMMAAEKHDYNSSSPSDSQNGDLHLPEAAQAEKN